MSEVGARYVRSAAGWIAYEALGSGPIDLLVHKPWIMPVDLMSDEPALVLFLNGLSRFSRHIWFDARGTGASDAIGPTQSRLVESVVDDMVAVADEVSADPKVVLGLGGNAALLFAATHPERTKALVLVNPSARLSRSHGYAEGIPDDVVDRLLTEARERWGTGWALRRMAPSLADDPRFARWTARCERLNTTPEDGQQRWRTSYDVDVRNVLGAIRVPTLVLYRASRYTAQSRFVADHIPDATVIELPVGDRLFFVGDARPMLDAIEQFVTGGVTARDDDRVLATVMFTDVVSSTEQLAEQGDRRWQERLDTHNTVVIREIDRFRGRAINTIGDGFVATFDGPGRAIRCAWEIRNALRSLQIDVRIGLHTGEIELRGDDIGGIAVHIAQRIQALARPAEVLASSTVKDLVRGSGIVFADRGTHALKGVPDEWHVFTPEE